MGWGWSGGVEAGGGMGGGGGGVERKEDSVFRAQPHTSTRCRCDGFPPITEFKPEWHLSLSSSHQRQDRCGFGGCKPELRLPFLVGAEPSQVHDRTMRIAGAGASTPLEDDRVAVAFSPAWALNIRKGQVAANTESFADCSRDA